MPHAHGLEGVQDHLPRAHAGHLPRGSGRGRRAQEAGRDLSFPFDDLAATYDREFSESDLGRRLRQAVWRRLDALWNPGDRILELACGTGEDAVHLARGGVRVLATDASPAMLEEARRKVGEAGLDDSLVEVRRLPLADLAQPPGELEQAFDGALCNFGGLNCAEDLGAVARGLAGRLRPGALAVVCLMGPWVPWEWLVFVARGRPREAFRRLRRGGVAWRGLTVRYPSIRAARRAFRPAFRIRRVSAVNALLPPTWARRWSERHPRLLDVLERWERRCETLPPLPWLADHYLVELERRS